MKNKQLISINFHKFLFVSAFTGISCIFAALLLYGLISFDRKESSPHSGKVYAQTLPKDSPRLVFSSENNAFFYSSPGGPEVEVRNDKGKITSTVSVEEKKVKMTLVNAYASKIFKEKGTFFLEDSDASFQYVPLDGVTSQGLKENIILNTKNSQRTYEFEIETAGIKDYKKTPQGDIIFYDSKNKEFFRIPRGVMIDSKGEKSNAIGLSISKSITGKTRFTIKPDNKWLDDSARAYPVIVDPSVVVTGGMDATTTQFGGQQRKVAYSNSSNAWYSFYITGGTVNYKKSSDGSTWGSAVEIDGGDTNNANPSVFSSGATLYATWVDTATNTIEVQSINTASSDALGTKCTSSSPGTLANTYLVSMAVDSGGAVYLATTDTAAGSVVVVYKLTFSGCSFTDITTGSGLTAGDRPVLATVSTNMSMIYQDGNLSHSVYSGSSWTSSNTTIAAVTDTVYSATDDGTNVWVLSVASAGTSTNFYKYDGATWTAPTSPWTSETNVTYVSLSYASAASVVYAHVIKDASNQAYWAYTLTSSTSWTKSLSSSYAFTAGSLSQLSSTYSTLYPQNVAVVLLQGSNFEAAIQGYATAANQTEILTRIGTNTDAWLTPWLYRKQIVFNNSSQAQNLTNFPVKVHLTSSNFDFSKAQSSGQDIRFTDSDGATLLPYEIEKWDSGGQDADVWVNVPQINASSSTDNIYMYYGNISATDNQQASQVWTNSYKAVYHLKETGSGAVGDYRDSTGNRYDGQGGGGTVANVPTFTASGQIDGAQTFDGAGDDIENSIFPFINFPMTISAWVDPGFTIGTNTYFQAVTRGGAFADDTNFAMGVRRNVASNSVFCYWRNGATLYGTAVVDAVLDDQVWVHIACSIDSSNDVTLYVNGASVGTDTGNAAPTDGSQPFKIGAWTGTQSTSNYWLGDVDEVEISTTNRSTQWIAATYLSDTDTFNTYQTEETPPAVTLFSRLSQISDTKIGTSDTGVNATLFGRLGINTDQGQCTSTACSNETIFGVLRNLPGRQRNMLSQFGGDGSEANPSACSGTGTVSIAIGIHQYAGGCSIGDASTATSLQPITTGNVKGALYLFFKGSLTVTNAAQINAVGFGGNGGNGANTPGTGVCHGGLGAKGGPDGSNGTGSTGSCSIAGGLGGAGGDLSVAGAGGGGGGGGNTGAGGDTGGGGGGGGGAGANGGNGGNGSNLAGGAEAATVGAAGTATPTMRIQTTILNPNFRNNKSTFLLGSYGGGGGGGGAVQARTGGADGGAGAGGGGGGGGVIWIRTHAYSNSGTVSANAGTAGANGTSNLGAGEQSAGIAGGGAYGGQGGKITASTDAGGGGGGGAGGGILYIEALSVTVNSGGGINARGGNGGNGGNGEDAPVGSQDGGAGANGFLFIEIVP